MAELFTNNAKSKLASGIAAGDLTLTVLTGDGSLLFPALTSPHFFRCFLFNKTNGNAEWITVTARTGDVFTIARAQEQIGNIAATAYAFNADDIIELRPSKGFFDSLGLVTSTQIRDMDYNYSLDTGSANAYVASITPAPAAYNSPLPIWLLVNNTNTGASTVTLLDGASLPITGSPKAITLPSGDPLVAGDMVSGEIAILVYDGPGYQLINPKASYTADHALLSSANVFAAIQHWKKGADLGSGDIVGNTLTLGTDGNYFDIDSSAGDIHNIATTNAQNGTIIWLHFDGALLLKHSATDLSLPGGTDITTVAGDEAIFVEYAAGDWRCVSYVKIDGSTPSTNLPDGHTATTQAVDDDSTQVATTQYVKDQIAAMTVGVGQEWQDMSASRAVGGIYENDTGMAIQVSISAGSADSNKITAHVGTASPPNVQVARGGVHNFDGLSLGYATFNFIVPAGHFYELDNGAIAIWAELRETP